MAEPANPLAVELAAQRRGRLGAEERAAREEPGEQARNRGGVRRAGDERARRRSRSGFRHRLFGLPPYYYPPIEKTYAITVLVLAVSALGVGCGSNNDAKVASEAAAKAHAQDRAQAKQDAIVRSQKRLQRELNALKKNAHHPASGSTSSGSSSTATPATPSAAPSLSACDSDISVSSATSCAFGENVFYEYYVNGQSSSLSAYSPTTRATYALSCSANGEVTCVSQTGATVQFSQASVASYSDTQAVHYAATHDIVPGG